MLSILKRVFSNRDGETIRIFENTTKIRYEPSIFLSLKALTISHTNLKDLTPLKVFENLETLNLSNNEIYDIECLGNLKKLKTLDLRFNQIRKLPYWIFRLNKQLHWERRDSKQEGIFLEGNPLDKDMVMKIKREQVKRKAPKSSPPIEAEVIIPSPIKKTYEKPKIEQLVPLNRQHVTIFLNKKYNSNFIDFFVKRGFDNLKLNISTIEYFEENHEKFRFERRVSNLKYTILVLSDVQCCIYPPILKEISHSYPQSKIFLIFETSKSANGIQKKIDFVKKYNKSKNIIEVYHVTNQNSHEIKGKIYQYLNETQEVQSLWKKSWIVLRDEVESMGGNLDKKSFKSLATKYKISPELTEYIFSYFVKVGLLN